MRAATGHVFIATSLDGFIARSDGAIDWLERVPDDGDDHGYAAFLARMDGLVMGRATFETVLGFEGPWPYVKPVVVMSRSLKQQDVPQHLTGAVRVHSGSPREVLSDLGAEGWTKAYVDGGLLIQSFLADGLIEDLVVTRVPVLLGRGRPLFGDVSGDVVLEHVSTQSFRSGLVQSHYRVITRSVDTRT